MFLCLLGALLELDLRAYRHTLPTVQSVTSVHALLSGLAIPADSLVLILQKTQHQGRGDCSDTCVVSCWQFQMHMLLVSSLGTTYTVLGVISIHVNIISSLD